MGDNLYVCVFAYAETCFGEGWSTAVYFRQKTSQQRQKPIRQCLAMWASCVVTYTPDVIDGNICDLNFQNSVVDENSRVILDKVIGEESSDYINASYINVS